MPFTVHDCFATGETDKAIFVKSNDEDAPDELTGFSDCTIPKSQIDDDSEVWKADTKGKLIVSDWLARQRGWTED